MTTISLAIMLQAATVGAGTETYAEAHAQAKETGQPLVVLVGADWCPACQRMKQAAMPQVARRGGLAKVSYAVVNTDHQGTLASRLMRGGSIPQLIMYRETPEGWKRESMIGAQDPATIEQFINRGLVGLKPRDTQTADQDAKPSAEQTDSASGTQPRDAHSAAATTQTARAASTDGAQE
ncbi:MAG: thioredoxin family protein [Planctomycetia bacterium]|nr:thioredoxin family protein [Planctomycetia bacterium]